ncbi:MAG: LysR family transcriptional regulator [Betaproteobacteria bacterium]|nr:LysR family transcriptional regulator [Betaproteobacteria bacterium]
MDFRDIEYFAVLAEHGHVGRAAEALGLSQPALSLSLRRLEQSLQVKLVKRTPKGVELTATGAALLSRVQRLRLAREDIKREISDLSQGRAGCLRVGAQPGVITDHLASACAELLKDAPDVELMVTVMTSQLLPALRRGELDLIVHDLRAPSSEDLMHEHLSDDPLVVFTAANHRLAKLKQVTIKDLAHERWARAGISENWDWFTQLSIRTGNSPPRTGIRTDSPALRDYLVANSNLLGYTTDRGFRQLAPQFRFAKITVKEMSRVRQVYVSYRKDGYLPPVARRFVEILKAAAK